MKTQTLHKGKERPTFEASKDQVKQFNIWLEDYQEQQRRNDKLGKNGATNKSRHLVFPVRSPNLRSRPCQIVNWGIFS